MTTAVALGNVGRDTGGASDFKPEAEVTSVDDTGGIDGACDDTGSTGDV